MEIRLSNAKDAWQLLSEEQRKEFLLWAGVGVRPMNDIELLSWLRDHDVQGIHTVTYYDEDPGSPQLRNSDGARVDPPSQSQNEKHCEKVLARHGLLVRAELDEHTQDAMQAVESEAEHYEENGPNFMVSRTLNELAAFDVYESWSIDWPKALPLLNAPIGLADVSEH